MHGLLRIPPDSDSGARRGKASRSTRSTRSPSHCPAKPCSDHASPPRPSPAISSNPLSATLAARLSIRRFSSQFLPDRLYQPYSGSTFYFFTRYKLPVVRVSIRPRDLRHQTLGSTSHPAGFRRGPACTVVQVFRAIILFSFSLLSLLPAYLVLA
jgi:hypothetical protein